MKKSIYAEKQVNDKYYMPISVTEAIESEQNRAYMPYKVIVTHTIIDDANGRTKIRHVSYWTLFKLWFNKLIRKNDKH